MIQLCGAFHSPQLRVYIHWAANRFIEHELHPGNLLCFRVRDWWHAATVCVWREDQWVCLSSLLSAHSNNSRTSDRHTCSQSQLLSEEVRISITSSILKCNPSNLTMCPRGSGWRMWRIVSQMPCTWHHWILYPGIIYFHLFSWSCRSFLYEARSLLFQVIPDKESV